MPGDAFEGTPYRADAVARALDALWTREGAHTRACLATLAIFPNADDMDDINNTPDVPDANHAPHAAADVLAALPARYPCRMLVVSVQPVAGGGMAFAVSVSCAGARRGAVCCETIRLAVDPAAVDGIPNALEALCASDLPRIGLWPGAVEPLFLRRVRPHLDRLVVDTARCAPAVTSALFGDNGFPLPRADLAWERLAPWRAAFARLPQALVSGATFGHIRIHHGPGIVARREGLLLAAWFCIHGVPEAAIALTEEKTGTGIVACTAGDGPERIDVRPGPEAAHGLSAEILRDARGGRPYHVSDWPVDGARAWSGAIGCGSDPVRNAAHLVFTRLAADAGRT